MIAGLPANEYWRLYRIANKEKLNRYSREYRKTHIKEEKNRNSRSYSSNRGIVLARHKRYYLLNKERIKRVTKEYKTRKRKSDPVFRLLENCRSRLFSALAGRNKSARTFELVGCSVSELRSHLEGQFKPGMTWENYGPVWHVDHRKPCAKFDLGDPAQQRECFHFSNLQPLFKQENLQKHSR